MPTPTYTALANLTLSSSASSVTFSSIPGTYRDLVLVISGSASSNDYLSLRFNSDSGSNYSYVYAYGNGSATASGAGTETSIPGGILTSSAVGQATFQVMDYSATDKHKTVLSRTGVANDGTWMHAGRWANTNAVTTILARFYSGVNYSSGTTFALYGIAS